MALGVLGLSHHTAPVEVREKIAFADPVPAELLQELARLTDGEAMILSTCNRVEIYATGADPAVLHAQLEKWLGAKSGLTGATLAPLTYFHSQSAAVHHFFRVAASLDSLIVGEPQILGQVKKAWEASLAAATSGAELGRMLPRALQTAKRVRSETRIARSSVSVASAATQLAQRIFSDLAHKNLLVVGAGKMATLAARHFRQAGCSDLMVVNRSLPRAQSLAEALGGKAHPWEELETLLGRADIVLCSTGATRPVIDAALVEKVVRGRHGRWLCLIDIAVPRDVAPEVGELKNVYLYDIDQLSGVVEEHITHRQGELIDAERIIVEELAGWQAAEKILGAIPTITALRDHFEHIAQAELEHIWPRLASSDEHDRQMVRSLVTVIVNKLLHLPTMALRDETSSAELTRTVRTLFALDDAPGGNAEMAEPK